MFLTLTLQMRANLLYGTTATVRAQLLTIAGWNLTIIALALTAGTAFYSVPIAITAAGAQAALCLYAWQDSRHLHED